MSSPYGSPDVNCINFSICRIEKLMQFREFEVPTR